MSAKAQPAPLFKAFDRNGKPLNGGRVRTFESGTSTPKATFQDAAGAALHANPIVLDAAGEAAVFWGTGPYRVRVEDAGGVLQWEVDGFDPQVADVPAPAVNLIANGSFEADTDGDGVPDGWVFTPYAGGTVDVDRYDADANPGADTRHGAAALRMVSPGGAGNGGGHAETANFFEVGEGMSLDVAFALICTAAGLHVTAEVRWHGTDKGLASVTPVYDEQAANPATWTELRAKVAVPAGARFAKVRLYGGVDDNPTAGTARFDHVTVRAVQPQYLRADEADQVGGLLTFANHHVMNNGFRLYGKDSGGNSRNLATMSPANTVDVGDAANLLQLFGAGTAPRFEGSDIWHAGNDGAGSGLDADTLDGVQGAGFVRSDAADQVDGVLTFAAHPALANNVQLQAKATDGNAYQVVRMTPADAIEAGHGSFPLAVVGTGLTFNGGAVWHAGNDGPGSGLDADTVDGQEASAFATAGHGHTGAEPSAVNGSDLTVVASGTVVVTLDLGTVQAGQRFLVTARVTMTKGATSGIGTMAVDRAAGTATFADPTGIDFLSVYSYMPAGDDHRFYATTLFTVLTGGPLTLRLSSASVGSDSTVFAGEGLLGAVALNL